MHIQLARVLLWPRLLRVHLSISRFSSQPRKQGAHRYQLTDSKQRSIQWMRPLAFRISSSLWNDRTWTSMTQMEINQKMSLLIRKYYVRFLEYIDSAVFRWHVPAYCFPNSSQCGGSYICDGQECWNFTQYSLASNSLQFRNLPQISLNSFQFFSFLEKFQWQIFLCKIMKQACYRPFIIRPLEKLITVN